MLNNVVKVAWRAAYEGKKTKEINRERGVRYCGTFTRGGEGGGAGTQCADNEKVLACLSSSSISMDRLREFS